MAIGVAAPVEGVGPVDSVVKEAVAEVGVAFVFVSSCSIVMLAISLIILMSPAWVWV